MGNLRIIAIARDELMQLVQANCRGGQFNRMNISVQPDGGLCIVAPVRLAGYGCYPDLPPFVARPTTLVLRLGWRQR